MEVSLLAKGKLMDGNTGGGGRQTRCYGRVELFKVWESGLIGKFVGQVLDCQRGDQLVGGDQLEQHSWHTFPTSWGDCEICNHRQLTRPFPA